MAPEAKRRPVESCESLALAWDEATCAAVIEELWALRNRMLEHEAELAPYIDSVSGGYKVSARNLAHYLALRHHDRRPLQESLAWIGLSSLGRAESHVLANLDKVLGILHRMVGQQWESHAHEEPVGIKSSLTLANRHSAALLGHAPHERNVRIMVTLPSAAASDYGMVRRLVQSGMDIARINCAHDNSDAWKAIAANVRRAAKAERRPIKIMMDLGGPKLRTGDLPPGPAVLKLRPQRNELGQVTAPAKITLIAANSAGPRAADAPYLFVADAWLAALSVDDEIDVIDARGAARQLRVIHCASATCIAETTQTVYLTPETELKRRRKGAARTTRPLKLPRLANALHLHRGDILTLTAESVTAPVDAAISTAQGGIAEIGCTLPDVFTQVGVGERIWFDDGRIGGVIRQTADNGMTVEITQAREGGEKLLGDKGINLPDSDLKLPALTAKDIDDLATVAKLADLVALSFVQQAADIDTLRELLHEHNAEDIGIVLKIETRRGFENLPELLFSAMKSKSAGVMIARGDLAVECGYERLAEVQEEILWAAEAAHLPVIWATQVLETLAKTGLPSRAEITDAAMGERAECVMLNKGPHIIDAMRTLDDILRRMQSHQSKKRPLLRALRAWTLAPKRAT